MSLSVAHALRQAAAAGNKQTSTSKKVVQLYRTICRDVPKVCHIYDLPLTVFEVRHLVGLHFRRNASVTDPRLIEMMLTKVRRERNAMQSSIRSVGCVFSMRGL